MFSLTEPLKDTVLIRGEEVLVDFSFDTVLLWYQILEAQDISSEDKIIIAFDNFIEKEFVPCLSLEEKVEIIDLISEYIKSSAYGNIADSAKENLEGTTTENINNQFFSYTQDAGAIYASFLYDYGIDLNLERGRLHYDQFKSLLEGLSDKSYFKRIIAIRQASPTEYEGQALTHLLEAQEYYCLDSQRTVNNLDNQMGDIFSMLKAQAEK
ncbi:hypothetical protein O5W32_002366 [Enterococcus faecium]|nr:hypothetical protein [Enterococcus faecium]EME7159774.1 hypothetical protein [Enterococcus faecium]